MNKYRYKNKTLEINIYKYKCVKKKLQLLLGKNSGE